MTCNNIILFILYLVIQYTHALTLMYTFCIVYNLHIHSLDTNSNYNLYLHEGLTGSITAQKSQQFPRQHPHWRWPDQHKPSSQYHLRLVVVVVYRTRVGC